MFVKPLFISLWTAIDPIYYSCTRLKYVHSDDEQRNIFRVRLMKYKGQPLQFTDGTELTRGDLLVKIHLHNVMLLKELSDKKSEIKKARAVYRLIEQSLPGLAQFISTHQKHEQIKGIMGITMLNRGAGSLGFVSANIQNKLFKWYKWGMLLPIHFLFSTHPWKRINKYAPVHLFMSKRTLMAQANRSNK